MAVFKCKMCGGSIEFEPGSSVGICEYCGTKQTLPRLDDEKKENLYDRANHFRRINDFDMAMGIYEQVLNEDKTDAEAYWSLVLCRYGIEYVEDPLTHKRIPTVNRAQLTSIYMDEDYKSALAYADSNQKAIYEEEAKAIDDIQKGILEISSKEEPFDIFICYKETDANGRRTLDSVLAQDIYNNLVEEGYKVFFSKITLEDKLGVAYEPYIFAALNSAKAMIVVGTREEYFNAVWVKNEWSRYLSLIKNGAKKTLIPAYRDMDPYSLPKEFAYLQALDMSKLGFMQDLVRGIKKIVPLEKTLPSSKDVIADNTSSIESLLKRAFMFLEGGEWAEADKCSEKMLNINTENAEAYLIKLMASLKVPNRNKFVDLEKPFDDDVNYKMIMRFGSEKLKSEISEYIFDINKRNEIKKQSLIYEQAHNKMLSAKSENDYKNAADMFKSISGFKDADVYVDECLDKAKQKAAEELVVKERNKKKRNKGIAIGVVALCILIACTYLFITVFIPNKNYNNAIELINNGDVIKGYDKLIALDGYKDSASKAAEVFDDYKLEKLKVAEVGDIVWFGSYEQDNNTSNGKEDIEWKVLDKKDNNIFVVSEYALDCKQFNNVYEEIEYIDCPLREWLNTTFTNNAFSDKEQTQIQETLIADGDYNPRYTNSFYDRVFLLSVEEARKYFSSDEERKCIATDYAKSQGASINYNYGVNGKPVCYWWLRTAGSIGLRASCVDLEGVVDAPGCLVNTEDYSVRPAMWINLD